MGIMINLTRLLPQFPLNIRSILDLVPTIEDCRDASADTLENQDCNAEVDQWPNRWMLPQIIENARHGAPKLQRIAAKEQDSKSRMNPDVSNRIAIENLNKRGNKFYRAERSGVDYLQLREIAGEGEGHRRG
ncbi:hypothetical protein EJB05_01931, partial [Eragrostis curvula]